MNIKDKVNKQYKHSVIDWLSTGNNLYAFTITFNGNLSDRNRIDSLNKFTKHLNQSLFGNACKYKKHISQRGIVLDLIMIAERVWCDDTRRFKDLHIHGIIKDNNANLPSLDRMKFAFIRASQLTKVFIEYGTDRFRVFPMCDPRVGIDVKHYVDSNWASYLVKQSKFRRLLSNDSNLPIAISSGVKHQRNQWLYWLNQA